MTIRCGGLLLLNPPKIGWESASAAPAVGKAICLDEITERDYPAEVRQRLCQGVVTPPQLTSSGFPYLAGFPYL
jgi:hypothetical protein